MLVRENSPAVCAEVPCHPPATPWGTVQLQKCHVKVLCFVVFLFLNTTQLWLFGYGTLLLLLWSSLLLYLLCNSFSRKPLRRLALWGPVRVPRVLEVRDASSGCVSPLSLAVSPHFPAVPRFVNLPAFILSANMYKM